MKNNLCVFYRPVWTCGKYNAEKNTAIMYNLLEGNSSFFEEEAAIFVGKLLNYKRDTAINLLPVSEEIGVDINSLVDFAEQLVEMGLLSKKQMRQKEIDNYRKSVVERQIEVGMLNNNLEEYSLNGAEEDYSVSINGWGNVVLELTYRCSEQCIHCYNIGSAHYPSDKNTRGDRQELTFQEYKRVVDELCEQGMFKVCLTGGDPFMSKSTWDLIEYLYEKEVATDIYTNGQALVGQCDRLAKLFPKVVGISVYSAVPNIHDKVTRVEGSFQKTLQVIESLYKLGIHLHIKCCVLNTNFDSYKSIYDLARKYNALPQIEINIRNTLDGNKYASKELRLEESQYEALFSDRNIMPYIDGSSLGKIVPRDFSRNVCRAGINSCTITPEGNVIPCPSFHMHLGNVREMSIREIFVNEPLKKWREISLDDYEECGHHQYCNFCAICPGENLSDTSSPLKASPNKCFMAKKRYAYAVKLDKEAKGKIGALNFQS